MTPMDDEFTRAELAKKGSPFLNTAQAAHYLGISARTLEDMRIADAGPVWRRHGLRHVRYHIDDLDAWSKTCKQQGIHPAAASDKTHVPKRS
jgi:excisionase family DNA binding protein